MGNCHINIDSYDPSIELNRHQFSFHYTVGKGGFGKVWRVYHRRTKQYYAMKEMSKARIIQKHSVNSVLNERRLLAMLKHPFIVNMNYAFQDFENLYLVMDFMPGGDLRYHLGRQKRFTETQTKFFVACVITGLEYLHLNGVIHRDIKPENLVLDSRGYVRITDFGIARIANAENAHETSGTPGYMAPEVLCRKNHSFSADYFAVGVITYEFMMGKRPYVGRGRKEIREAILAKQVQLKKADVPQDWSSDAVDFINKMLQRKPQQRLGFNHPFQVKGHSWFRDINWVKILEKTIEPQFKPNEFDNFDIAQVSHQWREDISCVALNTVSAQNMFSGYYFDINQHQQALTFNSGNSTANML